MCYQVLGFSNKYYTLWDVTKDVVDKGNGCKYIITHYYYVKNVSFNKDTAQAKYPNAKFDESIRGTRRYFKTTKEVWDNVDVFRFGKYKYYKINESPADMSYISWYWNNIDGDHKDYVSEILKNNGYQIRQFSNGSQYLVTPEELEEEIREANANNEMITKFNNHTPITLDIKFNPDFDGQLRIDNIIYQFEEVKENCYQGIVYYLPVLNGKAKRIKNKTITITDYDIVNLDDNNEEIIVMINDFTINK